MTAILTAIRALLPRVPTWVWYAAGVLALGITLVCVIRSSMHEIVNTGIQLDRAKTDAEAISRALNADHAATTNQMARDAITANQQQELRDEARKGDDSAVGPGTSAVLDRMRQQQSTGAR